MTLNFHLYCINVQMYHSDSNIIALKCPFLLINWDSVELKDDRMDKTNRPVSVWLQRIVKMKGLTFAFQISLIYMD